MLCLTLRRDGFVQIGDSITVTVLRDGRNVMLGIDAPREVQIVRSSAIDQPRHTDAELDVMVGLVRGEPLHEMEERLDRSDFEADMISAPRAKAMSRQIVTLQNAIEHLREKNADLIAACKAIATEPDYTNSEEMVRLLRAAIEKAEGKS